MSWNDDKAPRFVLLCAVSANLADAKWSARFHKCHAQAPRGDIVEAEQPFVANGSGLLTAVHHLPFLPIVILHNKLFHPLAQRYVLLKHDSVEGGGMS